MNLPFTHAQFVDGIAAYHTNTFPAIVLFSFLGLFAAYLLFSKKEWKHTLITTILGVLWMWTGITYHLLEFSSINKAAYLFGGLFLVEAVLFFVVAVKRKLLYYYTPNAYSYTGIFFIIFALFLYPLIGLVLGQTYPGMPLFPLPCPLTIFTFGTVLLTRRVPKYVLIIPLLWGIIGFFAAIHFGIYQDIILLFAAVMGTILVYLKDRR